MGSGTRQMAAGSVGEAEKGGVFASGSSSWRQLSCRSPRPGTSRLGQRVRSTPERLGAEGFLAQTLAGTEASAPQETGSLTGGLAPGVGFGEGHWLRTLHPAPCPTESTISPVLMDSPARGPVPPRRIRSRRQGTDSHDGTAAPSQRREHRPKTSGRRVQCRPEASPPSCSSGRLLGTGPQHHRARHRRGLLAWIPDHGTWRQVLYLQT